VSESSLWEYLSIILAGIATLAIFSYLLGENKFYRFFEHLFIGIAAGLSPVLTVKDQVWGRVLEPMLGLTVETFPDGSPAVEYQPLYLLYLIPMSIGLLYYTLYSRRHAWMAKVVIGITLGAMGALSIKGFFAEVIPQITSSFKPLIVFAATGDVDWFNSFNNTLFVAILILVLNYFFFTLGKEDSVQGKTAQYSRPLLMICFGAFFGSTVMARLALLVERVQFILDTWCSTLVSTFTGI
jgi:hypothetical protein